MQSSDDADITRVDNEILGHLTYLQGTVEPKDQVIAQMNLALAYLERGVLTKDSDDVAKAIELVEASLLLPLSDENKNIAQRNLGRAYVKSGELARASKDYTKAIESGEAALLLPLANETKVHATQDLGLAYLQRGLLTNDSDDVTKAIELGEAALLLPLSDENKGTVKSNLALAYFNSGELAYKSKDYTKAIESGEAALLLPLKGKSKRTAQNTLALAYLKSGELAHASKDYTKEIELGKAALQLPLSGTGKAMAHLYLADAYYERGVLTKDSDDFTKAIEASDAALQLPLPEISKGFAHGHRACAYNERGLLSKDLDDFTKAIAAGKAALLLPLPDEDKGIMQLHLSRAYLERGVFTKNSDDVTKAIAVGKAALLLPLPDEGKGIVRLHLSRAYLERGVFTKNSDDVTKAIESGFGALLLPLSDENKGVAEGNLDRAHQHRNREKLIRRTIDLFPQDDQEELLEEAFGKYSPRTIQHGALKGKEKTTSSFASIRRGVPLFRKKIEGTKRQVKEPNERHYGMLRVAPGNDDERFRALLKATILQCSGPNEEQADKADEALKAFDTLCDGQGKTKFFPVIVDVGKALADTKGNTVPQGDSCAYWEGNGKDARLLLSCNILEHDADVSEFGALLVEANRLVTTQSPEARLPGLVNGRRVRSPEYAAAYSEARNAHKDLEKSPAYGQASAVHRSDTSAPHLEESLSRPQATLLPTGAHARASTATQRPLRPSGTRTPSPDSDLRAAIQHSEGSNEQRRAR